MRLKFLGQDHPDVAITLCNIGILYQEQGKYLEAKDHYYQAIAIAEVKLGLTHPDTLNMKKCLASLPQISN